MSYGGDDRRSVVNGVNWGLTCGSITVVALRMFSRLSSRNFGLDDALILPAIIIQVAYVSLLSQAVSYGYGKHLWEIEPPSGAVHALYYATVAQSLAVLTFAMPKLAIVALLERLLGLRLRTRVLFWSMAISLVIFCLALSASWYAQCTPRAHQWDRMNVQGTCWNPAILLNYSYFVGAYSAFLDLFWAVFPPFVVANLRMPLYKKNAISAALGSGVLACAVTVYKCSLLTEIGAEAKVDPTWADVPLLVWTASETNVLIMAASLPTIGPFIRFVSERISGRLSGHEDDIYLVEYTRPTQDLPSRETSPTRPPHAAYRAGRYPGNSDPVEISKHVDMETTASKAKPSDRVSDTYRFSLSTRGNSVSKDYQQV